MYFRRRLYRFQNSLNKAINTSTTSLLNARFIKKDEQGLPLAGFNSRGGSETTAVVIPALSLSNEDKNRDKPGWEEVNNSRHARRVKPKGNTLFGTGSSSNSKIVGAVRRKWIYVRRISGKNGTTEY